MRPKKTLSTRVSEIRPSGIREIFDIACAIPDGIDLSIGIPDFDIPEPIKEEGIFWIKEGFNKYVTTRGIPELRQKISDHLRSRGVQFEDVLVTAGATGGYLLAMMALVSPGDEVLIPDPYFVAYANVVIMCGGVPKFINTYPDFTLRAEEIEPLITDRTRAIVVNTPNNPTGVTYDQAGLRMVSEMAQKHCLHIVSDEVYDKFVYTDEPFVSIGNVASDAIVISGFSKTAAMTGWRLGYVSGPKQIIDAMATFQQYSYVCANSIAQKAAIKSFEYDLSDHVQRYQKRRDLVVAGLADHFNIIKPAGAYFVFPEAPGQDAEAFVRKAIERKVFIIPGRVFSNRNSHFRISFAVSEDKLRKAIGILNQVARNF